MEKNTSKDINIKITNYLDLVSSIRYQITSKTTQKDLKEHNEKRKKTSLTNKELEICSILEDSKIEDWYIRITPSGIYFKEFLNYYLKFCQDRDLHIYLNGRVPGFWMTLKEYLDINKKINYHKTYHNCIVSNIKTTEKEIYIFILI